MAENRGRAGRFHNKFVVFLWICESGQRNIYNEVDSIKKGADNQKLLNHEQL